MSALQAHHQALADWWTPAQLAAPAKVWADDETQLAQASGAASAWLNRGAIGGSFDQATTAYRPQVLAAELNGRRVLRFDGSDDYLRMSSTEAGSLFRNVGAGWSFIVARKRTLDSSASRTVIYGPAANGASRFNVGVGFPSPNANRHYAALRRLDGDATASTIGSSSGLDWFMRRTEMLWSSSQLTDYVNGQLNFSVTTALAAGNTANTAANLIQLDLGADGGAGVGGACADVDLACVLIGSGSVPSADEWQRMEGWAAWRYGLQGNLPSGHPYKNHAP